MEQQDIIRIAFEKLLEETYGIMRADQFPEELEISNEEFVIIEEWVNGK